MVLIAIQGSRLIQLIRWKLFIDESHFLNCRILRHIESGFYIKLYGELEDKTESQLVDSIKLYKKVQSLKDDFVKISNLDLDYFEKLFVYLFAFNSLLAVLFVLRINAKFVRKKVKICFRFALQKVKLLKPTISKYQIRFQLKLTFKVPVCKIS